jgi:SAM-dependent methyltransferase
MTSSPPHPGHPTPPGSADDLYATPPPWDIGRPQLAFQALADGGAIRGRLLDAGCGTGEHALMCAALGLDVTGVDLAPRALHAAETKARDRNLIARFLRHDARRLADLGESFDTVLDCGLFHVFGEDRGTYVDSVRSVLVPGGRFFILCISETEPHDWGPHRITRTQITAAFAHTWRIDSIEPSTIEITPDPGAVQAWLVTLTAI